MARLPLTPDEARMDFAGWVEDDLPVIQRPSRVEWICTCPRCAHEKLAVNVQKRCWRCFRCGFAGWNPTILVSVALKVGHARAAAIVASYAVGVRLGRVKPLEAAQAAQEREIPVAPAPPGTLWRCDDATARYAMSRGIPSEHAHWFGLSAVAGDGTGSKVDRMVTGRLLIPVWDTRGRFVYWVARACGDDKVKTVNLPAPCLEPEAHPPDCTCKHQDWGLAPVAGVAGAGEVLVGAHLIRRGQRVVLVEGPIDAAVCGPGFVATMGAKLSAAQAAILVQAGVSEVVILFDPDDAGEHGAEGAYRLLSPVVATRVARCPDGLDPAELGRARATAVADATPKVWVPTLTSRQPSSGLDGLRRLPPPIIPKL